MGKTQKIYNKTKFKLTGTDKTGFKTSIDLITFFSTYKRKNVCIVIQLKK